MNTKFSKLSIMTSLCVLLLTLMTSNAFAQGAQVSNYFGGIEGRFSTFNGVITPIGSVIDIYDQERVLCGCDTISDLQGAGKYGHISVEGDDPKTDEDEGPLFNETLIFELNGRIATTTGPDDPIWDGAWWPPNEVNLSVEGATVAANFNSLTGKTAYAGDVVTYSVTVENVGNGLDFYTITALSGNGWIVEYDDGFHYVELGQTITIDFDLMVPPNVINTTDQIEYTVMSVLDNFVAVTGNVLTTISEPTDVDSDDNSALPGGFKLYQNYPNPFNPATTISFDLPSSSVVNLFVYDLLGRKVNEFALGAKSAGYHSFTFDAKTLSSGVYFYKIETENSFAMKRMLLLK